MTFPTYLCKADPSPSIIAIHWSLTGVVWMYDVPQDTLFDHLLPSGAAICEGLEPL